MNKVMKTIMIITFVLLLIAAFTALGFLLVHQHQEDTVEDHVSSLVNDTVPEPSGDPTVEPNLDEKPEHAEPKEPVMLEKYVSLYEENPDVIGWLKIEDSEIDYAVMQTPDEPDKYLHLDFYGQESERGTLYLDAKCNVTESDNLIIYGHNMKNGSMFGSLMDYSDKSFWHDHKYLAFDTLYEERTYEVVAAFYARIMYQNEEGFRYYQFIDSDEHGFDELQTFLDENQCYDTGLDVEYGDKLITLSTCAYHVENGRFAVIAKLVEPASLSDAEAS